MTFKASLTGRLGRKPEIRNVETQRGATQVCAASVATNRREKGQDLTLWVEVELWGQQAAYAADYLDKGSFVVCHGEVWKEEFTKRDGTPGAKVVLKNASIEAPKEGPREQAAPLQTQQPTPQQQPAGESLWQGSQVVATEEIPF